MDGVQRSRQDPEDVNFLLRVIPANFDSGRVFDLSSAAAAGDDDNDDDNDGSNDDNNDDDDDDDDDNVDRDRKGPENPSGLFSTFSCYYLELWPFELVDCFGW